MLIKKYQGQGLTYEKSKIETKRCALFLIILLECTTEVYPDPSC